MNNDVQPTAWCQNVILADADYVDRVAFDLTVNFERMIGRRIPRADMARWVDCVALDGGLRPGDNETLVVLVHDKASQGLQNFEPGQYAGQLGGQAFRDHLGEFTFQACPVEELTTKADYFADALQAVCGQAEVKRLMVIPNADDEYMYARVRDVLRGAGDADRQVTLFTMQPVAGVGGRQELLGYSLMAALGIRSDEIIEDNIHS